MDAKEFKDLKRALWEVDQKKTGGNIPYLEPGDILEIVKELEEHPDSKLNLSAESYAFYKKDFDAVRMYLKDVRQAELQEQIDKFHVQVEKDRELAIKVITKQNENIPWQVRKSPEQIAADVKMAIGQPNSFNLEYRKGLAKLAGGKLAADWNTVELDPRIQQEEMLQKNYDKKLAESKQRAANIAAALKEKNDKGE